ncbi:unnamed protein product [Ixodes persulcatus]
MRGDEELAALMPHRTWHSVRDHRQTPQYADAMRKELDRRRGRDLSTSPRTSPPRGHSPDALPATITPAASADSIIAEVTPSTGTTNSPPPGEFNLHARWTISELTALARAEITCGEQPHINLALARTFTTRSWQGITGQRNTSRYKKILESLKAAAREDPVPAHPGPLQPVQAGHERVRPQPNSGPPAAITQGLLDPFKIREELRKGGIHNASLEEALSTRPAGMAEVNIIFNHFNVSSGRKGATGGRKKKKRPPAKNRNQRRRERYAEHQRLYALGPKVLVDELRLDGADPKLLLGELHRVYDPLMSTPSRPVDGFITSDPALHVEVEPFTDGELRGVLN